MHAALFRHHIDEKAVSGYQNLAQTSSKIDWPVFVPHATLFYQLQTFLDLMFINDAIQFRFGSSVAPEQPKWVNWILPVHLLRTFPTS